MVEFPGDWVSQAIVIIEVLHYKQIKYQSKVDKLHEKQVKLLTKLELSKHFLP